MTSFESALNRLTETNAEITVALEFARHYTEMTWRRLNFDTKLTGATSALSSLSLYDGIGADVAGFYTAATDNLEDAKKTTEPLQSRLRPDKLARRFVTAEESNVYERRFKKVREYLENSNRVLDHFRQKGLDVLTIEEAVEKIKKSGRVPFQYARAYLPPRNTASVVPAQQDYARTTRDQSRTKDEMLELANVLMREVLLGQDAKTWFGRVTSVISAYPPSPEVTVALESLKKDLDRIGDNEQIEVQYRRVLKGRFKDLVDLLRGY